MSNTESNGSRENPCDVEACSTPNVTSLPLVGSWSATGRVQVEGHDFTQNDLDKCLPGVELNDTVVDFMMAFLAGKFDLVENSLRFSTNWYSNYIHPMTLSQSSTKGRG